MVTRIKRQRGNLLRVVQLPLLFGELLVDLQERRGRLIRVVLGCLLVVLSVCDLLRLALHASHVAFGVADGKGGACNHGNDAQIDKGALDAHTHTAVPDHPALMYAGSRTMRMRCT